MIIYDIQEKGKKSLTGLLYRLFVPVFVILIAAAAFGIGKIYTLEHSKVPISIEYGTSTPSGSVADSFSAVSSQPGAVPKNSVENFRNNTPAVSHRAFRAQKPKVSDHAAQPAQHTAQNKLQSGMYVASRGGTSYYLPTCAGAKRISEKNKIWFQSRELAEQLGYKPAANCKGLK